MFHLEVLAERLPLTSIFQNMTFIAYVQGLANVTKIAKFNLPSIYLLSMKLISRCAYAYIYIHYLHSLSKKICKQ